MLKSSAEGHPFIAARFTMILAHRESVNLQIHDEVGLSCGLRTNTLDSEVAAVSV